MQVRQIMTEGPACCQPDTSLTEVARMMADNDCGCIPVVQDKTTKRPVGTITDRDIALRSFGKGKNPMDLKAGDVMTSDIKSVRADSSVADCCNVMESEQIRRVLVVDESGACCGIVAQADVAQYASPNQTAEVVREISGAGSFAGMSMPSFGRDSMSANGKSFPTESLLTFVAGLGSGAALMYFLDPDRGRTRRSLVSDQVTGLAHDAQDAIGKTQRDLQNRAKGVWAETRKAVTGSAGSTAEKTNPVNTTTETNKDPEIGRAATHRY